VVQGLSGTGIYAGFRVIHKPAKADMIIAHSSDDVSTPPPVPPGPPAMMIHESNFSGVYVRVGSKKEGWDKVRRV
jgi:hypothetical protein